MSLVSFNQIHTSRMSSDYISKFDLSRISILAVLMLLFLTAVINPAFAGTYEVTYSGGRVVTTENGHSITAKYHLTGYCYGCYGDCGCFQSGTASFKCSGPITATFTFVPDPTIRNDEPPPAVVVQENCFAQASFGQGNSSQLTSISADDGLGFSDNFAYKGKYKSAVNSGYINGPMARYKLVQSPGHSFTITCSPKVSASITHPAKMPMSGTTAYGKIQFLASATPLMVNLGGGIGSQLFHQYLIGQTMEDTLLTGGLRPRHFHWKIAGGCKPFVSWKLSKYVYNRSSVIQTNVPSSGSVLLLNRDISAETASSLICFPKLPVSSAIAECKVDLSVPKGSYPKGGFHGITVKSFSFSVWNPLTSQLQIQPGSVNIKHHEIMGLLNYASDTFILMNVTTPPAFTNNGQTTGMFAWMQEVTPNRSYVDAWGVTHTLTNNGKMGLDNRWVLIANMADGIHPLDGTDTDYHINSTAYYGPEIAVAQNARSMHAADRYHIWIMYQPPFGTWVPIYDGTWQWSGTAVNLHNVWKLTKSACTAKAGGINPAFPEWNMLWTNDPGLSTYN